MRGNLDLTTSRRLNLAAAAHATPLVLLRPPIAAGTSAAATRWRIAAAPAARDRFGAFAGPRWHVALERCRNGRPGHWLIEWNHVAHRFRLVEGVADRAPAAARRPPPRRLTPLDLDAGRSLSSRRARAARASSALNRAARQSGLVEGDLLSNARSKVLDLQSRDADPAADAAALRKLALWCLRYTPIVAPWDEASGADGLFLDITGCAHLFGGEAQLLADLERRLRAFGLVPAAGNRRHGRRVLGDGSPWSRRRAGSWHRARKRKRCGLCRSPRCGSRPRRRSLLRRLGFKRIGEVIDQPRAPFAARFEPSSCSASTRRWGARPSRSSPSCRRPSIARRPCSSSRS